MKQAILITGGTIDLDYLSSIYERLPKDSFVLGVDGGCQAAVNAQVTLDAIIGDFDTLDEKTRLEITNSGVKTIRLNPVKNMTDTHAALDYLSNHQYTNVIIVGGRGSRADHSLGNLMVSFNYLPKMLIEFADEHNCIRPFIGPVNIKGEKQDKYKYLSIIPIEETSIKKSLGLRYPIMAKTLKPYDTIGVSNEIIGQDKDVDYYLEFEKGKFFLIESND